MNIHVKRTENTAIVEPADKSWMVIWDGDSDPTLYLAGETVDEDGNTITGYVEASALVQQHADEVR